MRSAALFFAVALAAGCSNTTATVGVGVALTFGVIDYVNNPTPFPSPSALFQPSTPTSELAASRLISEQDCSKPVDPTLGNLRCK